MKRLLLLAFTLAAAVAARAQSPTYANGVAQIVYQNCTNCHRAGGVAPFPLESYDDASGHSQSIKAAVMTKHMPPWPPDPTYRKFHGERRLRQGQIDSIVAWVDAGAPRGDASQEPAPPVFASGSRLTVPVDTLLRIPTYTVGENTDLYRCFVIRHGQNVQQWLRAIEMVPGNGSIVHHMLMYADTTGTCRILDNNDPGPGYTSAGGVGASSATLLGGWVPGADPIELTEGFGIRLTQRADIVLQIHYAPGSLGLQDSSYFRFSFAPVGQTRREVFQAPVLNHLQSGILVNGPLTIPAGQRIQFHERFRLPNVAFAKATLLSISPHAHLINRDWKVFALPPNNADTVPLIRIPEWHFHWQGQYRFPRPVVIEPGTKLEALAWYDNTVNNPDNPNDPPQTVTAGEGTHDEMMMVYFAYVLYQAGDENLQLFDTTLTPVATATRPKATRPAWALRGKYVRSTDGELPQGWQLRSADGRLLQQARGDAALPIDALPTGMYLILVDDKTHTEPIRFVVGR